MPHFHKMRQGKNIFSFERFGDFSSKKNYTLKILLSQYFQRLCSILFFQLKIYNKLQSDLPICQTVCIQEEQKRLTGAARSILKAQTKYKLLSPSKRYWGAFMALHGDVPFPTFPSGLYLFLLCLAALLFNSM